jgi:putative flippase GtrA
VAAFGARLEQVKASGVLGQLIRFGIVGGLSSVIYSAVYLPLTSFALPRHLAWLAVFPAFAVAVAFGFVAHSRWSFKDRAPSASGAGHRLAFVAVQGSGLVLNALYAWVLSGLLHQPPWVALIPAITVTPVVTFILNRQLVFAQTP